MMVRHSAVAEYVMQDKYSMICEIKELNNKTLTHVCATQNKKDVVFHITNLLQLIYYRNILAKYELNIIVGGFAKKCASHLIYQL
jgi:hypothetical protein